MSDLEEETAAAGLALGVNTDKIANHIIPITMEVGKFHKVVMRSESGGIQAKSHPEAGYWKGYRFPLTVKCPATVTSLSIAETAPHRIAVTCGARVQIYDESGERLEGALQSFKGPAYSGTFRSDGAMLVAGTDGGLAKVFRVETRAAMRTLRNGHRKSAAVRMTRFGSDRVHVFTGGDDGVALRWDLATQEAVERLEHGDYVRAGAALAGRAETFITGAYDGVVRVWDVRAPQPALVFSLGAPVESVAPFRNGAAVAAAARNEVAVLDLVAGKTAARFSCHQKTVAALAFSADGTRLLSAGVDQLVKVYELGSYRVVHSFKYDAPVLAVQVSPDGRRLVAGTSDGVLSVRSQPERAAPPAKPRDATAHRVDPDPATPELKVMRSRWRATKLAPYDAKLKRFEFSAALDAALETADARLIYSMLWELSARNALKTALAARSEHEILPLAEFLAKFLANPHYAALLISVCNLLLDIYSPALHLSPALASIFDRLRKRLDSILIEMDDVSSLLGSLETIMNVSSHSIIDQSV